MTLLRASFMQSRFYDPAMGRFLQPDSVVPDPADPQSLNRYSGACPERSRRVLNNPLRYTDPTGRCAYSAGDQNLNNLIGLCGANTQPTHPASNIANDPLIGISDPGTMCATNPANCEWNRPWGSDEAEVAQRQDTWEILTLLTALRYRGLTDLNTLGWSFDQRYLLAQYGYDVDWDYGALSDMAQSNDLALRDAGWVALGLIPIGGPKAGPSIKFDWKPSVAGHVFRDSPGHVNPNTAASRQRYAHLFEQVAARPQNYRGQGQYPAVTVYRQTFNRGTVWVHVYRGLIVNAGVIR